MPKLCQKIRNWFLISRTSISHEKFLVWKFLDFSFLMRNYDVYSAWLSMAQLVQTQIDDFNLNRLSISSHTQIFSDDIGKGNSWMLVYAILLGQLNPWFEPTMSNFEKCQPSLMLYLIIPALCCSCRFIWYVINFLYIMNPLTFLKDFTYVSSRSIY